MVAVVPWGGMRLAERERTSLELRRGRLAAGEKSVRVANRKFAEMRQVAPSPLAADFRLRSQYIYRDATTTNASDVRGPVPEERPHSSALVSSRGSALRFHLVALAEAQLRVKAGKVPGNALPLRPSRKGGTGWTDLLASWAVSHKGAQYVRAEDKRIRQIHSALDALERRRLVELPNRANGAGKYEGFVLLDETESRQPDEDPLLYETPGRVSTVNLPMEFITNGWVHALEDSELSVLLMIACGLGSITTEMVAIPSDVRVNNYGITRERFDSHRWLHAFGLIDVESVSRNSDGTAINFSEDGAALHRLRLRPDGFDRDAVKVATAAITRRLRH